jgi:hypothetical protein
LPRADANVYAKAAAIFPGKVAVPCLPRSFEKLGVIQIEGLSEPADQSATFSDAVLSVLLAEVCAHVDGKSRKRALGFREGSSASSTLLDCVHFRDQIFFKVPAGRLLDRASLGSDRLFLCLPLPARPSFNRAGQMANLWPLRPDFAFVRLGVGIHFGASDPAEAELSAIWQ